MKRKLLLPIIFSQAVSAYAWPLNEKIDEGQNQADAEIYLLNELNDKLRVLCGKDKIFSVEEIEARSNKIWKESINKINNSRISYSVKGTIDLNDRSSFRIGKKSTSDATSFGKYVGIDKWYLSGGLTLLKSKYADLGVLGSGEVTFIQQFPKRCKSIVGDAYNPFTKIPVTAKRAIEHLVPGEFVAFSTPLTLNLGKSLASFVINSDFTKSYGGFSIYATGEYNVHVYRMDNNYVRVRFFSAKTKGGSLNPGLKFYVWDGLASFKLIEGEAGQALSQLFSADYVFNLNDAESRSIYNKIMGEKFKVKKILNLTSEAINPFAKDKSIMDTLYADLTLAEEASRIDLSKDLESRSIIRLSKGDTETVSKRSGIGFDLRIVKARHRETDSESFVSFKDATDLDKNFKISMTSVLNEYNFLHLWGEEDTHNAALLVETDHKHTPLRSAGLQSIRVKEDLVLSKDELTSLSNRLQKLPKEIRSILKFPNIDKLTGDITRARIEQSIFLDTQVLESQGSITSTSVKEELSRLIQDLKNTDIVPLALKNQLTSSDVPTPQVAAFEAARLNLSFAGTEKNAQKKEQLLAKAKITLLEAYSEELEKIPTLLGGLFSKEPIQKKLEYYKLLQEIPMFSELGVTLVLNIISKADEAGTTTVRMADVVSYRLSITGRGIKPQVSEYPELTDSSANLKKSEIFQRIMNDNAYLTDRSFNLRYYMDEKGVPLKLKEVVDRSTARK